MRLASAPYLRAFERAAERLAAGEPLEEVCWKFPRARSRRALFSARRAGRQAGARVVLRADRAAHETRFLPLADAQGATPSSSVLSRCDQCTWSACMAPRPYLSINEALPCVTLSVATAGWRTNLLLCGDIDWVDRRF